MAMASLYKVLKRNIFNNIYNKTIKNNKWPSINNEYKVLDTPRLIPETIQKPSYYITGLVEKLQKPKFISKTCKNYKNHIDNIKEACGLASYLRHCAKQLVQEKTTPEEIDQRLYLESLKLKFYPAALHYRKFKKCVSISVNEVACHGIPDSRPLNKGDVVKIDCMAYYRNRFGDCCGTFLVGDKDNENKEKKNLIKMARKALEKAISICGPNVPYNSIGKEIEKIANENNLTILKNLTGHGIGVNLHELPHILPYYDPNDSLKMKEGDIFTIEPILTTGKDETFEWNDGWSIIKKDGNLCAQFEETVMITSNGHEVLTKQYGIDSDQDFVKD